jgi:hypothetical protein
MWSGANEDRGSDHGGRTMDVHAGYPGGGGFGRPSGAPRPCLGAPRGARDRQGGLRDLVERAPAGLVARRDVALPPIRAPTRADFRT